MPGAEQNSLNQKFKNLPINSAPGKLQLETTRACPQIWTQNVSDQDDFNEDSTAVESVTTTRGKSLLESLVSTFLPD